MLVAMAGLSIHCYLLLVSLWRLLGIDIRRLALVPNDWQALAERSLYTQSTGIIYCMLQFILCRDHQATLDQGWHDLTNTHTRLL